MPKIKTAKAHLEIRVSATAQETKAMTKMSVTQAAEALVEALAEAQARVALEALEERVALDTVVREWVERVARE